MLRRVVSLLNAVAPSPKTCGEVIPGLGFASNEQTDQGTGMASRGHEPPFGPDSLKSQEELITREALRSFYSSAHALKQLDHSWDKMITVLLDVYFEGSRSESARYRDFCQHF